MQNSSNESRVMAESNQAPQQQQQELRTAGAASPVTAHPLQDVALDEVDDAMAAGGQSKNWVKFEDDDQANNKNSRIDHEANATRPTSMEHLAAAGGATTAPPSATTAPNRLSPLPAPPSKQTEQTTQAATARPRSLALSGDVGAESVTTISNVAPAQRATHVTPPTSATSPLPLPDVAPAVLNTESIHVNLNASGRTQQQQQQQHQQHMQPTNQQQQQQHQHQHPHQHHPQQQYQKSKLSPANASAAAGAQHHQQQQQQQQAHYHNNNGSAVVVPHASGNSMPPSVSVPVETVPTMRTIELSTGRIREGFANGDVIVTLLPANTKWPWITPAVFRPELVPEELMAQGLTLTVEEYVNAMETLVNDYRFTMYNICYKRILVCWIVFAFSVLMTLLFSGLQGVALFALGVGWLFLNAVAIFLCVWVKLRLSRGLEKCLARVNRQLMKHKILLVLDDRGRMSCHKVNLCFMYFDPTPCVNFLNEFLEHTEQNGGESIKAGWERKLDIDVNDIVIQGSNPVRLSRRQVLAQELFLTYLQRWGKDYLRRRLDWTVQEAGVHESPRHLQSSICPCQYEEEVLRSKIKIQLKGRQCCGLNCVGCWL